MRLIKTIFSMTAACCAFTAFSSNQSLNVPTLAKPLQSMIGNNASVVHSPSFPGQTVTYSYFHFNDNGHMVRRVLFPNGGLYFHYERPKQGSSVDMTRACQGTHFYYPHHITNNNIVISLRSYQDRDDFGYITTWNADTLACFTHEIGAAYRFKDFNALAVSIYESDGLLLRYTPHTGVNEVVPTPVTGVSHAQINDAGVIAYSVNSSQSYFINANSNTSHSIGHITEIKSINNHNIVLGETANGCGIFDLNTSEFSQIDTEPCGDLMVKVNDNNLVLVDKPNSAAYIYRIVSGEKFNVVDLFDSGGAIDTIDGFNNNDQLFFGGVGPNYYSIIDLTLPAIPAKTYTVDNNDKGFRASSRWALLFNGIIKVPVPLAADEWTRDDSKNLSYGNDYIKINSGTGTQQVSWTSGIAIASTYEVLVRYPRGNDNNSQAHYTIKTPYETSQVTVNQQINAGQWVSLGNFYLTDNSSITVELTDKGDGETVADAIRFQPN